MPWSARRCVKVLGSRAHFFHRWGRWGAATEGWGHALGSRVADWRGARGDVLTCSGPERILPSLGAAGSGDRACSRHALRSRAADWRGARGEVLKRSGPERIFPSFRAVGSGDRRLGTRAARSARRCVNVFGPRSHFAIVGGGGERGRALGSRARAPSRGFAWSAWRCVNMLGSRAHFSIVWGGRGRRRVFADRFGRGGFR